LQDWDALERKGIAQTERPLTVQWIPQMQADSSTLPGVDPTVLFVNSVGADGWLPPIPERSEPAHQYQGYCHPLQVRPRGFLSRSRLY